MPTLIQLRKQIDILDDRIVDLLNRRTRLAQKIGGLKAHHGEKVYNPNRENELLKRLCLNQKGPLRDQELKNIYQQILQISRWHQKRMFEEGMSPSLKKYPPSRR